MSKTPAWKHFAAFIYDIFPMLGIFIMTAFIVVLIRNGKAVEQHTLWFDALIVSEIMFYYMYSWKLGGQTLGMRAWKIKIIPNNNKQSTLTWTQTSMRFLTGIISTLLLGLGLFWKSFSKDQDSWMDKVSDSHCQIIDS